MLERPSVNHTPPPAVTIHVLPAAQLEAARTHIAEMIGTWSRASEWERVNEWTWRKADGERIEIISLGGPRDYSLTDVKRAFWKMFHEAGEVWFSNVGTPEQNTGKTEQAWNEFEGYLVEPTVPATDPTPVGTPDVVLGADQPRRDDDA